MKFPNIRWRRTVHALREIYRKANQNRRSDMFDCSIELLRYDDALELVRLFGHIDRETESELLRGLKSGPRIPLGRKFWKNIKRDTTKKHL